MAFMIIFSQKEKNCTRADSLEQSSAIMLNTTCEAPIRPESLLATLFSNPCRSVNLSPISSFQILLD